MSFEADYELLFAAARGRPAVIRRLVVDRVVDGLAAQDALSLLPLADLEAVVDHAIGVDMEELLDHVSLQHPAAFTRHLPRLWELHAADGLGMAATPWRGADDGEVTRLVGILDDPRVSPFVREAAFTCLVVSRRPNAWAAALQRAATLTTVAADAVDECLLAVGIERRGVAYRLLCSAPCLHLALPHQILTPEPLWRSYWHPTWAVGDPDLPAVTFGGESDATCVVCRKPMRRLLLLDPMTDGLGVTTRSRLDIAYCYQCTGSEPSFHRHDEQGRPHLISEPLAVFPFQTEKTVAVLAGLATLGPRWALQDWAISNGRQNLNRLGGEPTWIQQPTYPPCPECSALMSFIAQLDWEHIDSGGGDGVTYIFWCDPCATSGMTTQQT